MLSGLRQNALQGLRGTSVRSQAYATVALGVMTLVVTMTLLLSRQTQHTFPAAEYDGFPRKIWQTWKTPAQAPESGLQVSSKTWTTLNPGYRYELLTDDSARTFVKEKYRSRPDIIQLFEKIEDAILKADLIRYLLLLADGGVYTDINTQCAKPIDNWIPAEYVKGSSLVVGIEYDARGQEIEHDFMVPLQLCQWTLLAKPGSPALQYVVDRVVGKLQQAGLANQTIVAHGYIEVLELTGPLIMTASIFEYLSAQTGHQVDHTDFTNITQPKAICDVLVMPTSAFESGAHHSSSRPHGNDQQLIDHHFHGHFGWRKIHPPESWVPPADNGTA